MKSAAALITFIFATAISAAPTGNGIIPEITVSMTNDKTGKFASTTVPLDGKARNIPDLFRNSPIDQDGNIMASSAQLIRYTENTHCFFQNVNNIINFNGRQTWADLDGNPNAAVPTNMNGFNLQCTERGY